MSSICDDVAERVALGEPLGELSGHVATCERCRIVTELPAKLGAAHHAVDPGLGFTARMTAGAQHRLVVRRRRRIVAGLASTVAVAAAGVFVMTRTPKAPPSTSAIAADTRPAPAPAASDLSPRPDPEPTDAPGNPPDVLVDDELRMLVDYADVDRSLRVSARWRRIEKPVSPYRRLIKGVSQ